MVPLWDPGNGALLFVTEKEKVSEKEFMRNGYLSRKGSGQRGDLTCRQKKKREKRKGRKGKGGAEEWDVLKPEEEENQQGVELNRKGRNCR